MNKISYIKKIFAFNTIELKAVFGIERETICDLLSGVETNLSQIQQEKLEILHNICNIWGKKNIKRLGNWLYRKIDDICLYDLLIKEKIDADEVILLLDKIESLIRKEKEKEIAHDQLLKAHGFKEITKEEMRERFENSIL